MRRKIIAGNWKMNMTPSEAVKLCEELKDLVKTDSADVVWAGRTSNSTPMIGLPMCRAMPRVPTSWRCSSKTPAKATTTM